MSCCGGNRASQRTAYQSSPTPGKQHPASGVRAGQNASVRHVTFEYTGPTAITVVGPATGATYRFSGKGLRLSVHGSDAPSLLSVPGLKPVL
jgi:hypothetical protein